MTTKKRPVDGFPARLRRVIEEYGSTNSLATGIERSEGGVRNWLRGDSEPSVRDLKAICELTGTSVDWLVMDRGPMKSADVAREAAALYGVKAHVEPALLQAVLEAVDEEIRRAKLELPLRKRAELVATLYDLASPETGVDRATVTRLVRLAA